MLEWKKARKKPIVIEFREPEPNVVFLQNDLTGEKVKGEIVHTREGRLEARIGRDFIIRGIEGELYPIDKQIFFKTYEVIDDGKTVEHT